MYYTIYFYISEKGSYRYENWFDWKDDSHKNDKFKAKNKTVESVFNSDSTALSCEKTRVLYKSIHLLVSLLIN